VRIGDAVLMEHPLRPGLLVVKRAVRCEPSGWWVEGDNEAASDDSRRFGPVPETLIIGRLVWRYRPLRRRD
jgi:nickel-type superoxide dismutase maturation protease